MFVRIMKNRAPILLSISTLSVLLMFSATNLSSVKKVPHARADSTSVVEPGNVAEGMYTITGEASHRCLEIASNSCAAVTPLQIFDCDKSEVSNNQKFNVVSDGSGNYTISP